jgi:hypothetical protein
LIDGIRYQCKSGNLSTPENYAQRFDWLQAQGYGWINLQAAGIFQDNLLVIIETPKEKRKDLGIPVSINISGPEGRQNPTPWKIVELVKILN